MNGQYIIKQQANLLQRKETEIKSLELRLVGKCEELRFNTKLMGRLGGIIGAISSIVIAETIFLIYYIYTH